MYSSQLPALALEEGSLRLIHPLSLCGGLCEASRTGNTDTLSQKSMTPLLNALTHNTYFVDTATPLTPQTMTHLTTLLAKHNIRVIGRDGCLHTVPPLSCAHSKKGSLQGGGTRPSPQQLQDQWEEFTTLRALGKEERVLKEMIQRCREAEDRRRVIEDKRNECLLRQREVVV